MEVHRNDTTRIALQDPLVLVVARWVLAIIGIVANSTVIFVFIYNRTFKKSLSLKLLLHQTVIDLIGSMMFLIFYNIEVPDGTSGTIFCKLQFLFFYMSVTSTYNFVVLTIERYIAVVHPITYHQRLLGGKITYLSLFSPHVCGLLLSGLIPVNADVEPGMKECKIEVTNKAATLLVIPQSLIPLCIMIFKGDFARSYKTYAKEKL
ncbi:cardioacceleratory peptide receptor-like [Anneissia japonica]|uniref:cardioacceleratory peptide receptor-like n=1 Tax=Anneissia japonica TaxID=1529436 RepID=UPI0014258D3D|nr:cardioacceleratory peptide receptor-like [Anneissia japonica]